MALPLTGLTTTLVKNLIGASTNNTGQLCIHSNVNKWAKFKPVPLAENAPSRVSGSTWYRATNGNCGLNIPNYSTMALMFTALRNSTVMWDYQKPTGGANSPYRLADFGWYEHNAQPPFIPLTLAGTYYASNSTLSCAMDLRQQSNYELTVNDLGYTWNLSEMYFGVAISKQGTTTYKYLTESTTISAGGGGGLDVPISTEIGTYDVVYFLAENPKTLITAPDISNTFIPFPNAKQIVIIKESSVTVTITAVWDAGKTNYELYVSSELGSVTLNNCYLNIKYGDNPMPSASQSGEVTISLGTITANPSAVRTGNVLSLPDYNTRGGGIIYFTNLSNSNYNMSDMIGSIE